MYKSQGINYKSEFLERIDITDYLRRFLVYLSEQEHTRVRLRNDDDVMRVCRLINIPENTSYKSAVLLGSEDGLPVWNAQGVVAIPSNLNKGAIFYFVCNGCRKRVKYLFHYYPLKPPLCRQCIRIPYQQTSYQKRKTSRLSNARGAHPMGMRLAHIIT